MSTDPLGPEYQATVFDLGYDSEGPVTATLVSKASQTEMPLAGTPDPGARATQPTVLYLHGFADYFFQTHLADFYLERGFNFYALDLRKCGRNITPTQTPHHCTSFDTYYPDIERAISTIKHRHPHTNIILNGHSAGGLLAALWAHDHREDLPITALVLNSPFLDLPAPWLVRRPLADLVRAAGRHLPRHTLPVTVSDQYVRSIHRDFRGEWDFHLPWKPVGGFPVTMGLLRAFRTAQRRVHKGLAIDVPILAAMSATSGTGPRWNAQTQASDTVLDVEAIARWTPRLGRHVTLLRIPGGLHDLTLSPLPARTRYLEALSLWHQTYAPARP